jgi:hypothetical protein
MMTNCFLSFLLMFSFAVGFSQPAREANAHFNLKGLGFFGGAKEFKHAAGECGIFGTWQDRQRGTLTMAIDCQTEDHRIKPGFIRDKASIRVVRRDSTYQYLRADIYGYRDCSGNEYHFFQGQSYQLVNPGQEIPIYRKYEWAAKQRKAKYFFRRDFSAPLAPLTLDNLAAEFSDEPVFLERLRLLADSDHELIKYLQLINQVRMSST